MRGTAPPPAAVTVTVNDAVLLLPNHARLLCSDAKRKMPAASRASTKLTNLLHSAQTPS
jgi:hypothetical protein